MLRVINVSRAPSVARSLSLVTKRYQQSSSGSATTASTKSTPGSSTTQSSIKNPPSASQTQTASTKTSSDAPIDRTNNPIKTTTTPPPSSSSSSSSSRTTPPSSSSSSSSSYPPTGGSGGTVKAIAYGVALGLGVTLLYAEYDNGSFRRKVESTLPLSSTILGGLDKIVDPIFGRQKKLTTIISEKLPDVSVVTNKLPDKEQLRKAGEQVKDAANAVYSKLPSEKQVEKAKEKAKDFINDTYDALPDSKTVKKTLTDAKEKLEDTAKSVKDTVKSAIPATKGVSGEPSRRGVEPVFLDEAGAVEAPPAVKR